jgi:hypothetical protein
MDRLSYLVVFLAASVVGVAFRGALSGTSEASPAIATSPPAPQLTRPHPRIDAPPRAQPPAQEQEPLKMVGPDGTPIQRLD